MSDKKFLVDATNMLNRDRGPDINQSKILDYIQGFANKLQESLTVLIISNGSDFYDYQDKENQDVLINKRKEYVIQALERVLQDKNFIEVMLTHEGKPSSASILRWIREEINPIISRDHKLDKNASPETIK